MQIEIEKRTVMNNSPFSAFIDLIALDQAIRTTQKNIAQLKQETDLCIEQKKELTDRFDQFQKHVHNLRKEVDALELEMKALDQQERIKKKHLDHLKNVHEYQPLKKEIDHLKQAQHHAENNLMSIWNKLEIAQKELEEQQKQYTAKIDEINQLINEKSEQVKTLSQQLEKTKESRPQKEIGIPSEWLEKYSHMRLRVADPVVPVMRGGCSACFYTITDQELLRLKRKALVQCKGCFRLLYMQEAMKENDTSSSQ